MFEDGASHAARFDSRTLEPSDRENIVMITKHTDQEFYAAVAQRSIAGFGDALREAQTQLASAESTDPVRQALSEVVDANAGMLGDTQVAHTCGGSFSWAAAFIWGTLNSTPTLDFEGWGSLTFAGTHWGAGVGGGISYCIGLSVVHPSEVIGDVQYEMAFAASVVTITFRRGGRLLLSVAGPALGVGAGAFSGSGKFTRA